MPTTLSPAAERVIGALAKKPGVTAAELVEATGLTRSAVGVALNALADQGLARSEKPPRASGAKGKVPARWYPTATSTPDPAPTDTADTGTGAGTGASTETGPDADATAAMSTHTGASSRDVDEPGADEPESRAHQAPVSSPDETTSPSAAVSVGPRAAQPDRDTQAPEQAEQDTGPAVTDPAGSADSAGSEQVAPVIALPTAPTTVSGSAEPGEAGSSEAASAARVTKSGRPYHRKGGLRAKVEAWLAAHPDQDVTDGQVGHAVDGSPGAIRLIFDKLVTSDQAILVSEKPKKVRWATTPSAQPTPAAPADAGTTKATHATAAHKNS